MKRLLAVVLLAAAPASALQVEKVRVLRPASAGGGLTEVEVVAGQAFVRFDPALGRSAREAALSARGLRLLSEVGSTGWTQVALPPGLSVESGLPVARSVAGVLEADVNHAFRPNKVPNDASFGSQYHLGKINASAAWEYGVGDSSRVTVAVVDAGIQGDHPDLQAKFVAGASRFCDPGGTKEAFNSGGPFDNPACAVEAPKVACNHGTRVAGVAAASSNNGIGVAGVSWGAQLVSVRVFRGATGDPVLDCDSGCTLGSCATDETSLVNAIEYLRSVNNNAAVGRVVANLSLGAAGVFACPTRLQNAISAAVASSTGMVIVTAAGNEGTDVTAPGNCAGVIPVGATDANDNVASFSNRGTALANNGVVAPGVSIVTTDIGGATTGGATGTSFSAPIVSGLAALLISAKPALSPTEVKDNIRGSAESIGVAGVADAARPTGNTTGAGRINAFRAVKLTVEGTLAGFAGDQKVIAFPNPFRTNEAGAVTITIPPGLAGKGASLKIYTIDGQLVRDLKTQTSWDGKNDYGKNVATGVYIILVKTDAGMAKARVAVIR